MPEHDPSLDTVMRTDRFVDALASGARMSPVDPLSAMLGAWRDDVRSRPDNDVITLAQAAAALSKTQDPPRRHRFGLTVVGAVAAAMLCLGGFGAVVYGSGPGDALYGLRSMLFGESIQTRNDAVALASQQLAQARQLVQEGKWEEAQQQLMAASNTVQSVGDVAAQQQLVEQYNTLTVQVIQRNPEATLPPPGEPLPPMPSSPLTLLSVPTLPEVVSTSPETPPVSTSLPTPTTPLPTPTTPLPTPTTPLPTPSTPLPTVTTPAPTVTQVPRTTTQVPATTAPSAMAPQPTTSQQTAAIVTTEATTAAPTPSQTVAQSTTVRSQPTGTEGPTHRSAAPTVAPTTSAG